jgi:hypothetical protein
MILASRDIVESVDKAWYILAGVSLSRFPGLGAPDGLLLAFTEKRNRAEIDRLVEVIAG